MVLAGCAGNGQSAKENLNDLTNKIGRTSIAEEYPKVPHDELLSDMSAGNRVYLELQERYAKGLRELKAATDRDSVKLVVVIMTPEVGKYATVENLYGIPYINQICTNEKVDVVDITPAVSEWSATAEPSYAPQYGNWSVRGAAFAATQIAPVIVRYRDARSPRDWHITERPATFGDATKENNGMDNQNDLAHGGHKRNYFLHLNTQGLRMDWDVLFPRTRQRILFMGDSRIFNPFIDDERTVTGLLQRRFPDRELLNAGNMSCSMDDYVSLYEEKARYTEPDLLILCTNGGDILDEYFSHRNRYSRNKKCYRPTDAEKEFYRKTFAGESKKTFSYGK